MVYSFLNTKKYIPCFHPSNKELPSLTCRLEKQKIAIKIQTLFATISTFLKVFLRTFLTVTDKVADQRAALMVKAKIRYRRYAEEICCHEKKDNFFFALCFMKEAPSCTEYQNMKYYL